MVNEEVCHHTKAPEDDAVALDAAQMYIRDLRRSPLTRPLTAEEEVTWGRRARNGERQAVDRMAAANTRLVVTIARRYLRSGEPLADLIAEGNLGLLHAIEKFDPDRGFRFSTYASWWIRQAIERGIMNKARLVRLPVHIHKEISGYRRAARTLEQETEGPVQPTQIAKKVGQSQERAHDLALLNNVVLSIDAVDEYGDTPLRDSLAGDPETGPESIIQTHQIQARIKRWLTALTPRQRFIVERRFGLNGQEPMTLASMAKAVGVTRERVRQIQVEALCQIQEMARADGADFIGFLSP